MSAVLSNDEAKKRITLQVLPDTTVIFEPAIPNLQTGSEIAFMAENSSNSLTLPVLCPTGSSMARISVSEMS